MWGLNPDDPFDSSLDDDADGAVNLVEYMAGTDPWIRRTVRGQTTSSRT